MTDTRDLDSRLLDDPPKTFLRRDLLALLGRKDLDQPGAGTIRALAESALGVSPPTVLDKKHMPPSEDKRDYFSHSIYWWPNEKSSDGFPYQYRDGRINPVTAEYDRGAKLRMLSCVRYLVLAWQLTGETRFAGKAAEMLRAWFLDEKTGMNPHMLYAQYVPAKPDDPPELSPKIPLRWAPGIDGQGAWVSFGGVIEGCLLPYLIDHAEVLAESDEWTEADNAALQGWFNQFLHWLLTHQHGKDEASTGQNHATYYRVQCVKYALFSGETEIAEKLLKEDVPRLMEEQIEPDGSMPHEYKRGIGLQYVTMNLKGFVSLAQMGEQFGLDFWAHQNANGGSLKKAIAWAAPYYLGTSWPFKPFAKPFDYAQAIPLLSIAVEKYAGEPLFGDALEKLKKQFPDNPLSLIY